MAEMDVVPSWSGGLPPVWLYHLCLSE